MLRSAVSRWLPTLNRFTGSKICGVTSLVHGRYGFHTGTLLKNKEGPPKRLWEIGKLNHVAIAVPDMEKASSLFRDVLGATVSEPVPQPEHGVYTIFVQLNNTKIELLHPFGEKSPIQNFLEKNKSGGMHHICIEVNNINEAIADLSAHKIRTLSKEPRIGAHGKPVVFLHPKDCNGVLVELEQE